MRIIEKRREIRNIFLLRYEELAGKRPDLEINALRRFLGFERLTNLVKECLKNELSQDFSVYYTTSGKFNREEAKNQLLDPADFQKFEDYEKEVLDSFQRLLVYI